MLQGGGAAARHPHAGVLRAQRHGLRLHHRAHPGVRPGLPHGRRRRASGAHCIFRISTCPFPGNVLLTSCSAACMPV